MKKNQYKKKNLLKKKSLCKLNKSPEILKRKNSPSKR